MSKRFKLKFPKVMQSFQICRSKSLSSLPENPKPAIYRLSPVNPKAFDIGYPNTLPAPPPSTPEYSSVMRRAATSSNIKSDGCGSCPYFFSDCSTELPCCNVKTTSFSVAEKCYIKKKNKESNKKKAKASYRTRASSFSSSNDYDEDEDSLVLLDSSRSFSNENYIRDEAPNDVFESARKSLEEKKASQDSRIKSSSRRRKGVYGSSVSNNKVRESVAVVKKSEDPYEDFKRSMLEMIMEKQMFESSDLEDLLQCFLTLNSRQYHGVIVEAFSEIWEILFSDSPLKHRLSF